MKTIDYGRINVDQHLPAIYRSEKKKKTQPARAGDIILDDIISSSVH